MYSDDRYYSQEHEWIEPTEDGEYVLGITFFAQEELGDVVFVELPEIGSHCDVEAEIGTIESVKAVAELFAPVAGEITAINDEVIDRPELLNEDPHGDGWLVRIRPDDPAAHEEMMTVDAYRELIGDVDQDPELGEEGVAQDASDAEDDMDGADGADGGDGGDGDQ